MSVTTPPATQPHTPLDDALDHLRTAHLEYGPGFSDHGPMVVEALDLIGRSDAVAPWLDHYAPRLDRLGERDEPLESMWIERLEREIAIEPWRAVVRRRVSQLTGATASAAGHGLLRTAHAVRGLSRCDTPTRRFELARALAYWEWRAERIGDITIGGGRPPLDVLSDLSAMVAPTSIDGMISDRLRGVVTPAFVEAVESVDLAGDLAADPAGALTRITSVAARGLTSAPPAGRFATLHGLTSSIAARDLLGLLPPADQRRLVAGVWTTVAALWAAYGGQAPLAPGLTEAAPCCETLVERAITSGDEHAIKAAVAVWSEEQATGDRPELRSTAAAALAWFGA